MKKHREYSKIYNMKNKEKKKELNKKIKYIKKNNKLIEENNLIKINKKIICSFD